MPPPSRSSGQVGGGWGRGHGFSPRGIFLIATSINKIAHWDIIAQQDSWQTAAYDRI
jgi:hypothetical protein